jgi:hypothetical protein
MPREGVVAAARVLLDLARPIIDDNLAGLTDDEYLWEPAADCWSVRRRGEVRSPGCWGKGEWVVEASPDGAVEPALTTIAWRLLHAYDCASDFADRAFGGPGHDWDEIEVPPDAATAAALMTGCLDDLQARLADADDDSLARTPDPFFGRLGFELLMKALHETIHHCAEIGVLRSLRRAAPS